VSSDEFEEIESNVFRATRSGVVTGFHRYLSEGVARSDGSGLMEVGATWAWRRAALCDVDEPNFAKQGKTVKAERQDEHE
jgi:hypothetical protein